MRRVKQTGLVLAIAICSLAVMATAAFGMTENKFVANKPKHTISEVEPAKSKGGAEEVQEWGLGGFKIECEKVNTAGLVTAPVSQTFTTTLKFSKCFNVVKEGNNTVKLKATFGKEGMTLKYHINGFAEAEPNESGTEVEFENKSEVEVLPVSATFKINAAHICTISIPAQTIPAKAIKEPEGEFSAVTYSNIETPVPPEKLKIFPSGFQKKVIFANEFKKLKFVFGGEGTQCEEFEKLQGVTGTYTGTFVEEVTTGNLSVEPAV